jgi:3',5'-cyclic AMP phosphodiesterase CpdA
LTRTNPRRALALVPILLGLAACSSSSSTATAAATTRFAVFSDPHLYDTATLGTGSALDTYIAGDRKMIVQSEEILDAALADLEGESLDFVLVTGDLTKDGEKVDHELFASKLAALEAAGTKVYVVPGNHDVNNPDADSYPADGTTAAVENVTPAQFKAIYARYGYDEALSQDPASLSYVAEPVPGLWILAIDSCKYEDNATLGTPVTSGAIRAATLTWIQARLAEATAKGKLVIGMQHHGVVEHFAGQATLFADYLVDDRATVAAAYAAGGLNVVFTGHFHANDATASTDVDLTDVETGSLVTYPSPYRLVNVDLSARSLTIHTGHVDRIDSHPTDFEAFAYQFLVDGLSDLTIAQLESYGLSSTQAASIAPLVVDGFAAHYAGDEVLPTSLESSLATLTATSATLGAEVTGLWTDLAPADNDLTVALP